MQSALAHFWKLFALLVAGLIIWMFYDVKDSWQEEARRPNILAQALHFKQTTVMLKDGKNVKGYFSGLYNDCIVLSRKYKEPPKTVWIAIPLANVSYISATTGK